METIQEKTATLSIEHDALIENLRNSIYIVSALFSDNLLLEC